MNNAWEVNVSEPNVFATKVRMVGTGASAPTEVLGAGIAITYIGVGQYRLTWADNPGTFAGATDPCRQATTPGDVKGMDFVFGAWNAATSTADAYIDLYVYDGGAPHDLAALEWLAFDVFFKRTRS